MEICCGLVKWAVKQFGEFGFAIRGFFKYLMQKKIPSYLIWTFFAMHQTSNEWISRHFIHKTRLTGRKINEMMKIHSDIFNDYNQMLVFEINQSTDEIAL